MARDTFTSSPPVATRGGPFLARPSRAISSSKSWGKPASASTLSSSVTWSCRSMSIFSSGNRSAASPPLCWLRSKQTFARRVSRKIFTAGSIRKAARSGARPSLAKVYRPMPDAQRVLVWTASRGSRWKRPAQRALPNDLPRTSRPINAGLVIIPATWDKRSRRFGSRLSHERAERKRRGASNPGCGTSDAGWKAPARDRDL